MKQVQRALSDVESILSDLEGLGDIGALQKFFFKIKILSFLLKKIHFFLDENSLNELERRLEIAEEEVKNASLDDRMQVLKDEKLQQSQLISSYQDEVDKLREEVFNIEKIANSLPDGCFKREQKLEL